MGRSGNAAGNRSCSLHGCGALSVSRCGNACEAGRISATSKHPTETNIVFMLDTLELYTIKRRMRAAQAKLRQDRSLDDEARRVLTVQAAQGFAASTRAAKVDRRRGGPVPFDWFGDRRNRTGLDVVVNQRILAYIQSDFWV